MRRLLVAAFTIALLAIPIVSSSTLAAPTCGGRQATIVGTAANNLIRGTDRRDVIVARGGHDEIFGRGGRDIICGGNGRDTLNGGSGGDRIFGDSANDTLKGGPGFDRLDGGTGLDACYTGADGGTKTACEPADLAVEITAPESAAESEVILFTVRVRNLGGTLTGAFTLEVADEETSIVCSFDHDASFDLPSLGAGQSTSRFFQYDQGCVVQPGSDPHLDITAEVEQPGSDADPSNDLASVRIDIIEPTTG